MSMLAGPKRKQKWTLNPRGKHWSEDSNKFGQKMLEKMGWSNGKGLGAKGQGMVEHIRVRVKNDQVGIGYTKDRDDQWTEHQDDFNNFLQNLQKEQTADTAEIKEENNQVLSGQSLEEKSKKSQKRVHYKKFTRGKDVNKYSAKDLANIFGKKDLNDKPAKEEDENEENILDPVGVKDMTAGILTIKGGNMNDYFKKKFHANEQSGASQDKENSDSETEKYTGFGFSEKSKSKFYVNDNGDPNEEDSESETEKHVGFGFSKSNQTKSKSKKLNNLDYVFDNPCLDLNILDDNCPVPKTIKSELKTEENAQRITPKKRKNEFIYDNQGLDLECPDRPKPKKIKSEFVYENKGLDLEFKDSVCENSSITKIENSEFVYDNKGLDLDSVDKLAQKIDDSVSDLEISDSLTSKKAKKIKFKSVGYENPALEIESPCGSTQKKSKKNKESQFLSNGIENSALDLEFSGELPGSIPTKVNKCKKSKNGVDNPALNLKISDTPIPKKYIKIKNIEILSNGIDNVALDLDFPDKPTPKKNKKNKITEVSNGIENTLVSEFPDELLKPTSTKIKKSKDSKIGIENPALNLESLDISVPKKNIKIKNIEILSNGFDNAALDLKYCDELTPKKIKKRIESEILSNGFENPALDLQCAVNEMNTTTDFEVLRTSCGVENNALDLSDENTSKKRVTFNDEVEFSVDTLKKKKKKKKLDKYEVVSEKLKQTKSVEPITFVNEALDEEIANEEEIDNEVNERKSKKCKRKRQRRISLLETIEEAPEEEVSEDKTNKEDEENKDVEFVGEFPSDEIQEIRNKNLFKKKCKRKKDKENDCEGSAVILMEEKIKEEEETDICEKPTKIKKKKNNHVAESGEDVKINNVDDFEKENLKKKKDKKKKISSDEDIVSLEEFLNEEPSQNLRPKVEKKNTESATHQIEKQEFEDSINENSFKKFKKSKQVMKSMFIKNPTLIFNGSNINDIKGYGSHVNINY